MSDELQRFYETKLQDLQSQLTASQARVKELEARQPLHPVIQMAAEPALQAELAKPLSIHSEHPPLSPCDHDDCLPTECVRNRDKERIATLEQALREAWEAITKSNDALSEYSDIHWENRDAWAMQRNEKALTTISTALKEKEGR